jgi:hypothetical protein
MISIAISYAFAGFLSVLKKHRDRFFDVGDIDLGLALGMLSGWPNFVAFLPIVFLSIIIIGIIRGIFFKEAYTTLGWPFVLAFAIIICPVGYSQAKGGQFETVGDYMIMAANLSVLRI